MHLIDWSKETNFEASKQGKPYNSSEQVIMVGNPMLLDENREGFDKVEW